MPFKLPFHKIPKAPRTDLNSVVNPMWEVKTSYPITDFETILFMAGIRLKKAKEPFGFDKSQNGFKIYKENNGFWVLSFSLLVSSKRRQVGILCKSYNVAIDIMSELLKHFCVKRSDGYHFNSDAKSVLDIKDGIYTSQDVRLVAKKTAVDKYLGQINVGI